MTENKTLNYERETGFDPGLEITPVALINIKIR
jgi:hypothetical protein